MLWIIISLIILIADQAVKAVVISSLEAGETAFSALNIFDVTYVQNRGAAFSVLTGKTAFLCVVSLIFCIVVVVYCMKKRPSHPLLCASLAMLFAGAAGNGIDRIFRGYVVDYINLTFMSFPVFNIADIGVTIGAVLFVVYVIWFDKEGKNADDKN